MVLELQLPGGVPSHTRIGKKRKPTNRFFSWLSLASGIACEPIHTMAGGVKYDGSYTPANRLTETCTLGFVGVHL